MLGGCGEASCRDQETHYRSGFKAAPQEEVQTFSLQPELARHQRRAPAEVAKGDVLECRYTWQGRLQMLLNQKVRSRGGKQHANEVIMDFDTGRPLDPQAVGSSERSVLHRFAGSLRPWSLQDERPRPTTPCWTCPMGRAA